MMGHQRPGRHNALRVGLGLVLLAGLLAAATRAVRSQPSPPMRRYGRAFVNFEGAKDGTLVEVESFLDPGGWTLVASDFTETFGGEKGWYGKPEALEIEGEGGVQVRYSVAGKEAIESPKDWESGSRRQDLNIRQAWLGTGVRASERVTVDTEFEVSAVVTNTGLVMARNVKAVLSVSEGAHLAAGEIATKTVGVLGYLPWGDTDEVIWTLACTATIPVTITVTPSGIDDSTGDPIDAYYAVSDTAVVEQQTPAYMVGHALTPLPGEAIGVGEAFVVTASISNTGQADALDVTATLTHSVGAELVSSAEQTVGGIPGGGDALASWTLVCTDTQPVTVTVMPAGFDGNSGEPVPAEPAQVMVEQRPSPYLEALIHAPSEGDRLPYGSTFVVEASVENAGEATATSVSASLSLSGGAVVSGTEGLTRTLGTLPVGASGQVSWTLRCTEIGSVMAAVAPAGLNPELGRAIPERRVATGTVSVKQTALIFLPMPCYP